MFINLCRDAKLSDDFLKHNFRVYSGSTEQMPDPSNDVAAALRDVRGFLPNFDLIPTLSFTLSPQCCRSFLETHRSSPISERDYYLSKLYQFFVVALLDEGCETAYFERVPERLESILDRVFPIGVKSKEFSGINWKTVFDEYKRSPLETVIEQSRLKDLTIPKTNAGAPHAEGRPSPARRSGESVSDFINRRIAEKGSSSIEAFALEYEMSPSLIYRVKKRKHVKSDTLTRLADALNCLIDDLVQR